MRPSWPLAHHVVSAAACNANHAINGCRTGIRWPISFSGLLFNVLIWPFNSLTPTSAEPLASGSYSGECSSRTCETPLTRSSLSASLSSFTIAGSLSLLSASRISPSYLTSSTNQSTAKLLSSIPFFGTMCPKITLLLSSLTTSSFTADSPAASYASCVSMSPLSLRNA